MAIIRGGIAADHFTIVPNAWLRDPRLSYKAKGLLAYVASHSAGYRLTVQQMISQSRDGRDAVYSGIKELVQVGYLVRVQIRNDDGTVGEVDYQLVDPSAAPEPTGRAASGKAASGKPVRGSDQGEGNRSAAQTASGKAATGKSVSGEADTKKTKVLEHDLLEDQENTPLRPASAKRSAPSSAASNRGDGTRTENLADELTDKVLALAPHWSASVLASVLADPKIQERPRDVVVRAVLAVARGDFGETVSPRRLLVPGPWWPNAGSESRGAALPPATGAARCPLPGHVGQLLTSCSVCRSEALGGAA